MAAPTLASSGTTSKQASGATLAVNVPAHSAGDLLLCFISQRSAIDFSVDGSWVIVDQWEYDEPGLSETRTGGLAAIVATGSGTTLTITVGASDDIIAKCVQVTGHGVSNPLTDISKGTQSEGESSAPDPPNLSGLASNDYLYLAMICLSKDSAGDAISNGSSGYTDIVNDTSGAAGSTSSVNLWAGYKQATGSTGDSPAAGLLNATDAWGAQTYAIPATVGTQNISATGPSITITAGTPAIALSIAPTGPTVTITPGTVSVAEAGTQEITPTGASVTITPGTPGIGLSVAPTGASVTVTPGTPSLALNVAPTGASVTITPGTPTLGLNIAPTGVTVTVTEGSVEVSLSENYMYPDGATITITAGTVTVEAFDPVYYFTPTAVQTVPRLARDTRGPARRLGRYLSGGYRAPNVFILTDGTVTEVAPDGENVTWDDVARVFYGGHVPEVVNDEEKALLEAAGYTPFLL